MAKRHQSDENTIKSLNLCIELNNKTIEAYSQDCPTALKALMEYGNEQIASLEEVANE